MKRRQLTFLILAALLIIVAAALAWRAERTRSTKRPEARNTTSVATFLDTMQGAAVAPFRLTYDVTGYLFFGSGSFVIAQLPNPPGTKVKTNRDGYSGSGRNSYLFRGTTGRIVQWIKIDTIVSACANFPISGNYETGAFGEPRCSRPSPFLPSNGFAEEDAGFVPNYVLQQVTEFAQMNTRRKTSIRSGYSRKFGRLLCLTQYSGQTTQTTCLDHEGNVVSWFMNNGSNFVSRVVLTSFTSHPTFHDFTPIVRPTSAFFLPAV